jgi:hypothetical protein
MHMVASTSTTSNVQMERRSRRVWVLSLPWGGTSAIAFEVVERVMQPSCEGAVTGGAQPDHGRLHNHPLHMDTRVKDTHPAAAPWSPGTGGLAARVGPGLRVVLLGGTPFLG